MLCISVHRVGGRDGIRDDELLSLYIDEQLFDARKVAAAVGRSLAALGDDAAHAGERWASTEERPLELDL